MPEAEVIVCPVCGTDVSLEDTECPNCGAEFAPGITEEPQAVVERHEGRREVGLAGYSVLVTLVFAVGYGTVLVANYVSLGGTVNTGAMDALVAAGAITILISFIAALTISRAVTGFSRIAVGLFASFIMMLPGLIIVLRW